MEVLPPTDRAVFVAPPELAEIRERFAAGDFRGCVDPLEILFFARRNTLHQGLLQYVVGLLQLRNGMVRTPRRLFRQATELISPYPEWQEGFDLRAVREHMAALLHTLPVEVDKTSVEEAAAWWIEPPCLVE